MVKWQVSVATRLNTSTEKKNWQPVLDMIVHKDVPSMLRTPLAVQGLGELQVEWSPQRPQPVVSDTRE